MQQLLELESEEQFHQTEELQQLLKATGTPPTQSAGAPAPIPDPAQGLMLTWLTGSGGTARGTRGMAGIRVISRVNISPLKRCRRYKVPNLKVSTGSTLAGPQLTGHYTPI